MSSADIQKAQEAVARAQALLDGVRATRRAETTTTAAGIELERQATRQLIAAQNDLQRVQQAAAGNPPANSVNPAVSPVAAQLEGFVADEYGIPPDFAEKAEPLPPSFEERLTAFLDEPDPIPVRETPVSTTSPAAEQAEEPVRTSRRQRAQAQRSAQEDPPAVQQAEETFDEFSDQQRDISVEPAVPTQDETVEKQVTNRRQRAQASRIREREPADPTEDAEVNDQQSNRERSQAQRIENAAPGELSATSPAAAQVDSVVSRRAQAQIIRHDRIVASDPTSYESLTDEQLRAQTASTQAALNSLLALPTQERLRVQTQIDALENQLDLLDQETARRATRGRLEDQVASGKRIAEDVDPEEDKTAPQDGTPASIESTEAEFDEAQRLADEAEQRLLDSQAQALLEQARNQATVAELRKANGTAIGDGDWRVRLRLAPNATYLYKDPAGDTILAPLLATDGVIFPYTPKIDIAYRADYSPYDPTHSNYRHYFYKGSRVEFVTLTATFTAQDTQEANYLLAVIHFMKSASKMFYGQDAERGSPPPLLYLTGLGDFQFNEHPCVLQEFNYNLPDDVDYIRARSQQISGANTLQYQRPLSSSTAPSYSLSAIWDRLRGANLPTGATPTAPGPLNLGLGGFNGENPTYVPTRLTMTITLLPVQSRRQVSQQFSLKDYASGKLMKGGFW